LHLADAGVRETVIADTIGAAAPVQIQDVLQLLLVHFSPMKLGLHLHDTRGMALANAWAAIQLGIRRFDASVGGLGGCPFAPGAAGNLATEDLVLMASQCGLHTGVDLVALMSAVALLEELVGHSVGGRSARWLRTVVEKDSYMEGEKWPS
jgi:hydroxymethylglutaryl-CoA lyase